MRNTLIISLIFSNSVILNSQNLDAGANSNEGLFVFGITNTKPPTNLQIKGSQYFEKEFKLAFLKYYNKKMDKQGYMRYNGFTDEIEISSTPNAKFSETVLLQDKYLTPIISNETFVYLPHRLKDNRPVIGYLIQKYSSKKYKIYEKRKKVFMEEVKARTSLENSFPPRYIDKIDLYISIQDNTPFIIPARLKGFINLFKNSDLIKKHIKENNLKISAVNDIIEIVKFAETIR